MPSIKINPTEWLKDVTRWFIPILVGLLVSLINHFAWLIHILHGLGIHTDTATITGYVTVLVALLYSALARILEAKFPKQCSWLLGFAKRAHILQVPTSKPFPVGTSTTPSTPQVVPPTA